MIYKFRVILDVEEDVFRDIAIEQDSTLEDLHCSIYNAFGFDGTEMGSFYNCNDQWEQGYEIPLIDHGIDQELKCMNEVILSSYFSEENTKILYVYDFLSMWTFFVELAIIEEKDDLKESYPTLLYAHGELPSQAPERTFSTSEITSESSDVGLFGESDLDLFDSKDSFDDDYSFDDSWN